jgi:hypothetical protein
MRAAEIFSSREEWAVFYSRNVRFFVSRFNAPMHDALILQKNIEFIRLVAGILFSCVILINN